MYVCMYVCTYNRLKIVKMIARSKVKRKRLFRFLPTQGRQSVVNVFFSQLFAKTFEAFFAAVFCVHFPSFLSTQGRGSFNRQNSFFLIRMFLNASSLKRNFCRPNSTKSA
jgi:hypothetical protein